MNPHQLRKILEEGKLKTYHQGTSFLDVYWSHPDLGEKSFCLLKFTAANDHFIEAQIISPTWLPRRRKPNVYQKRIEGLVRGLLA